MKIRKKIDGSILYLLAIWLLIIFLINPNGDFPINDDWAYGIIVKRWLETGTLRLINWGEMTLIGHLFYGYAFTTVLGFSFTVLRWSTLLLSLGCLLGVYQTGLLIGLKKNVSFFITLLVVANPVFMALSFSFMTDVPFMTFVTWSMFYFIKAFKTGNHRSLILAIVLCVWAVLIRQLALVLPIVWVFTLFMEPKSKNSNLVWKWLPILVVGGIYISYHSLMGKFEMLPSNYGAKLDLVISNLANFDLRKLRNSVGYIFVFFTYMGLFLAPLMVFFDWSKLSQKTWLGLVTYTVVISVALIMMGKSLPSVDNVFIDFGVGPSTLLDHPGGFRSIPNGRAPMLLRWGITVFGTFFGGVMWLIVVNWIRGLRVESNHSRNFAILFTIIYLSPFIITGYYDRYLIILLPSCFVIVAKELNFKRDFVTNVLSRVTLFVFMLFSVFATHDFLSWNRVRWKMINELLYVGVPPNQIEGGVEFDGLYHFTDDDPEWWERINPVYKVTFVAQEGYEVLSVRTYNKWMPGKKGQVYLSKIIESENGEP